MTSTISLRRILLTALAMVASIGTAVAANCSSCKGSGTGPFKCVHCKGTGSMGNHKCDFCLGKGYPKCSVCKGTGQK